MSDPLHEVALAVGIIWAASAAGSRRAGELPADVAEQFCMPAADIVEDVLRTLERFLAAGLLGVIAV